MVWNIFEVVFEWVYEIDIEMLLVKWFFLIDNVNFWLVFICFKEF